MTHLALRTVLVFGVALTAGGGAHDRIYASTPIRLPVSAIASRPRTYVLATGEAGAAPVYPVPPGLNFIFPLRY